MNALPQPRPPPTLYYMNTLPRPQTCPPYTRGCTGECTRGGETLCRSASPQSHPPPALYSTSCNGKLDVHVKRAPPRLQDLPFPAQHVFAPRLPFPRCGERRWERLSGLMEAAAAAVAGGAAAVLR